MISATDSFVKYLHTELAGTPPVHWVRKTANDTTAHLLKHNTLNVSILMFDVEGSEEKILVSLDILGDDERATLGWAKTVREKLIERQFTSELDYEADPVSPESLGRMVSWDGRDVAFELVRSDEHNVHVNATFYICHVRL